LNCAIHESSPAIGTCVRCGKAVCQLCANKHAGKIYCDTCAALPTTDKSKIVAGLLAIFLGTLGIHKFYLGRTGWGVAYLLISILGIVLLAIPTLIISIVAFIEGIILLCMSDEKFAEKYGKAPAA